MYDLLNLLKDNQVSQMTKQKWNKGDVVVPCVSVERFLLSDDSICEPSSSSSNKAWILLLPAGGGDVCARSDTSAPPP